MKMQKTKWMGMVISVCMVMVLTAGCGAGGLGDGSTGEDTSGQITEVDPDSETYAQLTDGYDPEEDTNLDAQRTSDDEVSLAGTAININGESVTFTNSKLTEYCKISPNRSSPRKHKIDTITIHCMAGQLSVETCGNVYANSKAMASANYGVGKDGRIGLYVEEKDRSWASSNAENDNRAVTIEVASDSSSPYAVSDAAYNATIKLVADICKRNKIEKLVWSTDKATRIQHLDGANMTVHRDFANKACPGDYLYDRMGDIAKQVNEKLGVE